MVMPGKDGLQTILEVRQVQTDLAIVAILGGGISPKVRYLSMAGCLSYIETLSKPFLQKDVRSIVSRFIF